MQDEVLIAGFGRRGHAVGDIPGVRFKVRHMHILSSNSICSALACEKCVVGMYARSV